MWVVGMAILLAAVADGEAGSAAGSTDGTWWFSHGMRPVDAGATTPREMLGAISCKSCHQSEYADWSGSRHHQAWTNPLFQEGFDAEGRVTRCVYCHAPLKQQLDQVQRGASGGPGPEEGVSCATCHVRDGTVFGAEGLEGALHPSRVLPGLREPSFCAGCHQFNFSSRLLGGVKTQALASQNTYNEWLAYREGGGRGTCQTCHMPGGRHTFHGAHDGSTMRRALALTVERSRTGLRLKVGSVGVGHRLPTGDLFRRITIERRDRDGTEFQEVASIGRRFELVQDPATGNTVQKLVADTTLQPFEFRKINVAGRPGDLLRIRYHFTSDRMERRSLLDPAALTVTLYEAGFASFVDE